MLWHKVGKRQYSDHQVEKYSFVLKQLVQYCFTFLTNEGASRSPCKLFFSQFHLCVDNTSVLIQFSFKDCAVLTFLLSFLHFSFLHCLCLSVSSSKAACSMC